MKEFHSKPERGMYSKNLVYLALKIPPGRVTTYGILNKLCGGAPRMAMMIAKLLSKSERVKEIPFHRIVYSDGRFYNDPQYNEGRLKLLKKEGTIINEKGKVVDFKEKLFYFDE